MFTFRRKNSKQDNLVCIGELNITEKSYNEYLEILDEKISDYDKAFKVSSILGLDIMRTKESRAFLTDGKNLYKVNLGRNDLNSKELELFDLLLSSGNLFIRNILLPVLYKTEDNNIIVSHKPSSERFAISTEDYMAIQSVLMQNNIKIKNAKDRCNFSKIDNNLRLVEFYEYEVGDSIESK